MKRQFLGLWLGLGLLVPFVSAHANPVVVGDGATLLTDDGDYSYYAIDGDVYAVEYQQKTGQSASTEDRRVYIFHNLRGVAESGLPQFIKDEIYADYDVPASPSMSQLASIETGLLVVDENAADFRYSKVQASFGSNVSYKTASSSSGWLDCGGRWDRKVKRKDFDITPTQAGTQVGNGGSIRGRSGVTGSVNMDVHYSQRENPCFGSVPYRFRWDDIHATGNLVIDDFEMDVEMTLVSLQEQLFRQNVIDYDHPIDFAVGPVLVRVEMKLDVDVGVDLFALVKAYLSYRADFDGTIDFDLICTKKGCDEVTPTVTDISLNPDTSDLTWGLETEITVMPYLDVVPAAVVRLYGFRVADLSLNARMALPYTLWTYDGNACGDADRNGSNEMLHSRANALEMQMQAYIKYKVFGDSGIRNLGFPTSSSWRPFQSVQSDDRPAVRKLLTFNDNSQSNTVFEPMIEGGSSVNPNGGGFMIGSRRCYPYDSDVTYRVNFGDGTGNYDIKAGPEGKFMDHNWASTGGYTITARMIKDAYGRRFDARPTSRAYSVVNGAPIYYPPKGDSVVTVNKMVSDGSYTVQWNRPAQGAITHYELYEATNPYYQDDKLVWSGMPSNPNLPSKWFSKSEDGTYYYRVRACNDEICTGYYESSMGVQVYIRPDQPVYLNTELEPDLDNEYSVYAGNFDLIWGAPASGNVTHYELQESMSSSFSSAWTRVSANVLEAHFGTKNYTSDYYYRVRACNGPMCSPWTEGPSIYVWTTPDDDLPGGSPNDPFGGGLLY